MTILELINQIDKAFDGVEYSATSLRQFVLTDEYGLSRDITDIEWSEAGRNRVDSKWQEIPDAEIAECGCMLAHMDAKEFRYFLPAYIKYTLKNYRESFFGNNMLDGVIFSVYPSTKDSNSYHYNLKQLSLLNTKQELAIGAYLKFVASSGIYESRDAEVALERYWNKIISIIG